MREKKVIMWTRVTLTDLHYNVFLLRKIALPYPHKCLVWFCGAKHIDRQEFFKEIFLSREVTPCLRMSALA